MAGFGRFSNRGFANPEVWRDSQYDEYQRGISEYESEAEEVSCSLCGTMFRENDEGLIDVYKKGLTWRYVCKDCIKDEAEDRGISEAEALEELTEELTEFFNRM